MTMNKRLSMTGDVEDCEAIKETIAKFGHGCDLTASDEGSESSVNMTDHLVVDPSPIVPGSATKGRRRSWFGMESRPAHGENDCGSAPSTPRRRSLFGLPTATLAAITSTCFLHDSDDTDDADEPKKPSSLRKSIFTTKNGTTPGDHADDYPSERSESTCSSRPPPVARRRSALGSSSTTTTPCLDDALGRIPPLPGKDGTQSVSSDPRTKTRRRIHNSVEPPPRDRKRGVDRAKSMDSPRKTEKGKIDGGLWSSQHGDAKNEFGAPILASPGTPKTPVSFRRLSLGSLLSALTSTPVAEGTPGGRHRRCVSGGASAASPANGSKKASVTPPPALPSSPPITSGARSTSTGTLEGNDVCITNPFDLVNKARVKRNLHEYSRNMLMDTLAKQVAIELAASNGSRCTPTSYHGNVGQGESIESIHKTMMKQKGRTARSNLLAPHFNEIGIGIARNKDGLIFLCQLFK